MLSFAEFPPTAGQLVYHRDEWHITVTGEVRYGATPFRLIEFGEGYYIAAQQTTWATAGEVWRKSDPDYRHDSACTLLLPSRQQLEAAGATCWDALRGLPIDGKAQWPSHWIAPIGDGRYLDLVAVDHRYHGSTLPDVYIFPIQPLSPRIRDAAVLLTAANRLAALTAWLAQWTIEEKGGVSKEARDETTGTGRIHD